MDSNEYKKLHLWIRKNKSMSSFCEKCGKITDRLDAANISGEYKKDISDFRWLCRKCHANEPDRILKISLARRRKYLENLAYCYLCKSFKKTTEFYKEKSHWDGISKICKLCAEKKRKIKCACGRKINKPYTRCKSCANYKRWEKIKINSKQEVK